jgi:hypothetical protein
MNILVDLSMNIVPYLPRMFTWWLYKPERTLRNITVDISARQRSTEILCDREQAKFSLWIQFKNDNPFPVEIDRLIASGNLHTAHLEASNLLGTHIKKGECASVHLEGGIDEVNLARVNSSPDDPLLRVELCGVIANKYHTMRTFRKSFDDLMCRLVNKKVANSGATAATSAPK